MPAIHRQILAIVSTPFWILEELLSFFIPKNCLRVIILHDLESTQAFLDSLIYISLRWSIILPSEFEDMITGKRPIIGRNLLITFDDGFSSNYMIAKNILDPLDIKAIFFIVVNFVRSSTVAESRNFIMRHIQCVANQSDLPENWSSLSVDQVRALCQAGHTIGSHTLSHPDLSTIDDDLVLQNELASSKTALEDLTNVEISHFAYPYGTAQSISRRAYSQATAIYKFIHTGLRGDNSKNLDSTFILRDPICMQTPSLDYAFFSPLLVRAFLDGSADWIYARQLRRLMKSCVG